MDGMECGCDDSSCYWDGDGIASVFTEVVRTARKEHKCCECQRTITQGEKYHYISGLWDGSWDHYKTCEQCFAIARDYACNCYQLGCLRDEIWELLGVDIVTGKTKEDG